MFLYMYLFWCFLGGFTHVYIFKSPPCTRFFPTWQGAAPPLQHQHPYRFSAHTPIGIYSNTNMILFVSAGGGTFPGQGRGDVSQA